MACAGEGCNSAIELAALKYRNFSTCRLTAGL